jgi:lipoyl synthase
MSDLVQIALPHRRPSGPARPVADRADAPRARLPSWLRVKLPSGEAHAELKRLVRELALHTVCEEASCPNVGECWNARELTLMILGDTCTRSCGFCDVATGRPAPPDRDEPRRVAQALGRLGLAHAVVTSVDRDELPDGGASIWAETIARVREACPDMSLEVLVPDFRGRLDAVDVVLDAGPHVFAHNVETVPRLHPTVRPQARYDWTLAVLRHASSKGVLTKSGVMLGLGERDDEVLDVLRDLAAAAVDIVTLGQYLRPSPRHLAVERFVPPEAFDALAEEGRRLGLRHVEAGPLVRSSYHAGAQYRALRRTQAGPPAA